MKSKHILIFLIMMILVLFQNIFKFEYFFKMLPFSLELFPAGAPRSFSFMSINPYFIDKNWSHRVCLCWGTEWHLNPGLIDALASTLATEPDYLTPKIKKATSPLQ